ncbi:MAG: hypothetical protein QOE23_776, partial [Pseudonocardiales bacterium]|nr:hypothetical protein [Pseudonocardiales bacterium]
MTVADRRRSATGSATQDRSESERPAFVEPAPVCQTPLAGLCCGAGPGLRRRFEADEPDPLGGTAIPGDVIAALRRTRGGGQPLPEPMRRAGGEALGLDLSPVRVHTDPEAARLARSVQASAFTYGHDIYFSAGAYRPSEPAGQQLISHELGHLGQS